jgi:hypothetical protein
MYSHRSRRPPGSTGAQLVVRGKGNKMRVVPDQRLAGRRRCVGARPGTYSQVGSVRVMSKRNAEQIAEMTAEDKQRITKVFNSLEPPQPPDGG